MRYFVIAIPLLTLTAISRADDTAIEGIGGSIKMMRGHPTIRMVSEEVHVKLPDASVRAVFVFHNDGSATSVKIGFPETGSHPGDEGRRSLFGYFRSYVDGKPIKVKREGSFSVDEDDSYHLWWTKTVRFARHQTRVVVDEYQGGLGGDTSNHGIFTYVMSTGASWKGPIGRARITVDARGLGRVSELRAMPEGAHGRAGVFRWQLTDIKPDEDDDIHLSWWNGFKDIWVNDRPVYGGYRTWDVNGSQGNAPPRCVGRDVCLPVRGAASFLGCGVQALGSRSVELTLRARRLVLRSGSRRIGGIHLRRALWVHHDRHYGPSLMTTLRPLVKALGGRSWWDRKGLHIRV